MNFLMKYKHYFFPEVSEQAEKDMDKEAVKNIYYVCFAIAVLESLSLVCFVISKRSIDAASYVSIRGVAFCIAACVVGHMAARIMLEREYLSHTAIVIFEVVYYISFSVWGIVISYRHYSYGEQMLTFFTVQLLMVCFILLHPIISTVLMATAYISLYVAAYSFDSAARIHPINYLLFMMVSIVGMIVRYHLQLRTSQRQVSLEEGNIELGLMTRLDGLTGIYNRRALDEDIDILLGKSIKAFMIDINYFKEINDNHGHLIGDDILRETGERLKRLYPECRYYRYGGDEFLVICENEDVDVFSGDTYSFRWPDRNTTIEVMLSIGRAGGKPEDKEGFFALITAADGMLYKTKVRTHDPNNGGHERRARRE
ncbi:MAG: GGDEF domain-containing protein [Lachnospiraceae bacterium]|nr:GGDEF domain-containing protein [Lachnospiraceae bacterium]